MGESVELNPSLNVDDLKNISENTAISMTCAALKRFSNLEKDLLCATNAEFKQRCANYCRHAASVPTFVLNETAVATTGADDAGGQLSMRNLHGSYMLQPSDRWKTVAYANVDGLDACNALCVDNVGCTCKLSKFNATTKECILDCPTDSAIETHTDITLVPFFLSSESVIDGSSFEKIQTIRPKPAT